MEALPLIPVPLQLGKEAQPAVDGGQEASGHPSLPDSGSICGTPVSCQACSRQDTGQLDGWVWSSWH